MLVRIPLFNGFESKLNTHTLRVNQKLLIICFLGSIISSLNVIIQWNTSKTFLKISSQMKGDIFGFKRLQIYFGCHEIICHRRCRTTTSYRYWGKKCKFLVPIMGIYLNITKPWLLYNECDFGLDIIKSTFGEEHVSCKNSFQILLYNLHIKTHSNHKLRPKK